MWPIVYQFKKNTLDHKIRRNFVSFSHCLISLFLSYTNVNIHFILINSASYFIWDMWYIIIQSQRIEWFNLLHHLMAIIPLCSYRNSIFKHKLLTMMETSNIPNYIVYDLIQSNDDTKTIKLVQFLWFGYFRTIKIPEFIYKNWNNYDMNMIEISVMIIMLIMGYIWTFWMGKKLTSME